ncbi:MAG: AAA family ATPase [Actinomycetota bacterium]|nr:AAA family ATPase [Actinomycetota bacterium]
MATVLFGDLVGFTTLSETLDPEHVKNLVDRCFERLAADITSFGGQVDKIIGDAIVALFGAPVAHEDDAERAVRAALRMQETIATFGAEAAGRGVRMRIGVNTGEVLVGALRAGGSTTAMGDVVNTASRLQTSASPGEVLVGPSTYASTRSVIAYEARGLIQAKGREEPVAAWAAVEALLPPGHRPRRLDVPLVGRDHELAVLRHSLNASISHDRAQVVLLLGDPGLGKTRLTEEIGDWAALAHRAVVLQGRCVPYGEANRWWPVAEALRQACQVEAGSGHAAAGRAATERVALAFSRPRTDPEVVRVANGLVALMGYEPSREVDPSSVREEGVRSLIAFLEASSRRQPVVIELSDLQWADPVVLELIDTIFDRLQRHPVVLLATSRPSLLDHWTPRPGRFNVVRMHLDALDSDASTALLTSLLGSTPSTELAQALIKRSGGNPFFLEELVALLGEEASSTDLGAETTSPTGRRMTDLPDTLRGLVAARLDALTSDERAVVQDAAVLGRREPVAALREMAHELGRDVDIDATVRELVDKEILMVDERDIWSFKSDVVREVAYNTITKYDRAKRHAGIAAWHESHLPADGSLPDLVVHALSHHLGLAAELAHDLGALDQFAPDLRERALTWIERAAVRASDAEALPLAIKLFGQALVLVGPEPTAHRLRLLLGRAGARTEAWELPGARADVEEAAAEAADLGDAHCAARSMLVLGQVEQKAGETEAALEALGRAATQFHELGDEDGRAEAYRQIGMAELFRGNLVEAERSVRSALDAFRAVKAPRGEAWALQNLAWIAFQTGHVDEAERRLQDSTAMFSEIGDTSGMAWSLGLFSFVRFQQGRIEEAEALASQILAEARARGDRWAAGMMLVLLSSVRLWSGRTSEAIELATRAQESFEAIHDPFGLTQAGSVLGRALAMSGRIDEGFLVIGQARMTSDHGLVADDAVNQARTAAVAIAVQLGELDRLAIEGDDATFLVPSHDTAADLDRSVALALALVQQGDAPGALARIEEVTGRTEIACAYAIAVRALAEAAVGDGAAAVRSAKQLDEVRGATYLDRVMAAMGAGLGEARLGHRVDALRWLGQARVLADDTGDVVAQAVTRLAESTGLSCLGDGTAEEAHAEAQSRLDAMGLGARGWAAAFDLAVGATPVPV